MSENLKTENRCGFVGGGSIYGISSFSDMIFFFECINYDVLRAYPNENFDVITDRLYKRYLRLEELDEAVLKMKLIEDVFKTVKSDLFDWSEIAKEDTITFLDFKQNTLFEIFKEYFEGFNGCVESTKIFFKSWNKLSPVMISPTNIFTRTYYSNIPLCEFENIKNNEKPFWLCPYTEYKHWSEKKKRL
jgi:hypothetical protein